MEEFLIPRDIRKSAGHSISGLPYAHPQEHTQESTLNYISYHPEEHMPDQTVQIYFEDGHCCVLSAKILNETASASLYDARNSKQELIASARRSKDKLEHMVRGKYPVRELENLHRHLRVIHTTMDIYSQRTAIIEEKHTKHPAYGALIAAGCVSQMVIEYLQKRKIRQPKNFSSFVSKGIALPLVDCNKDYVTIHISYVPETELMPPKARAALQTPPEEGNL